MAAKEKKSRRKLKNRQNRKSRRKKPAASARSCLSLRLLAVGGIGYYVKIVRPKQQAEDDAEFEDDGYGEGFDPDEAYGEPEYLSEDDFDDKDSK